jgi:hypothetical protein
METPDVYPDVLGDALSYSSQRLAQLGSLVTAGAVVEAQRRAQANAARAARDEQALTALQDQERAARQLARAGWAPAHDSRWLAQAGLLQAARVWSAATAYADADPTAASAARKCEEHLRALHPYAMAWYDRLRSEGAGAFDAMRQALPLFARAPYARPGDPAGQRRALEYDAASRDGDADSGLRPPSAGSSPDLKVEQRGHRIVEQLQARALAERGYALSPDELVTTLGTMTTLPSDVIARLAHADSKDLVTAGAEPARADDLHRVSPDLSLPHDIVRGEHLNAADQDRLIADAASAHAPGDRTAVQLAAESFPCTAADAVRGDTAAGRSPVRRIEARNVRRPGHSV